MSSSTRATAGQETVASLRAGAHLLEDLAQVGRVVLELALARGGLPLEPGESGAQRRDRFLSMG